MMTLLISLTLLCMKDLHNAVLLWYLSSFSLHGERGDIYHQEERFGKVLFKRFMKIKGEINTCACVRAHTHSHTHFYKHKLEL